MLSKETRTSFLKEAEASSTQTVSVEPEPKPELPSGAPEDWAGLLVAKLETRPFNQPEASVARSVAKASEIQFEAERRRSERQRQANAERQARKLARKKATRVRRKLRWVEQNGGVCFYCERKVSKGASPWAKDYATVEHLVPRALGGSERPENKVMACRLCNLLRGSYFDAGYIIRHFWQIIVLVFKARMEVRRRGGRAALSKGWGKEE